MATKRSGSQTIKGRAGNGRAGAPMIRVRVCMYRPGLGDCFLLSFENGRRACHVLIDCGVFVGTPGEADRLRKIVADIHEQTGGTLDLLVLTHEHWDHLSGFIRAKRAFSRLTIRHAWLGWVDDGGDPLARRLRQERRKIQLALGGLAERLNARGSQDPVLTLTGKRVGSLLSFVGPLGNGRPAAAAGTGKSKAGKSLRTTADVVEWAGTRRAPTDPYLRPGMPPLALPDFTGVKVYVLGPPRDAGMLGRLESSSETYGFHRPPSLSTDAGFLAALASGGWSERPWPGPSVAGGQHERESAAPFPACPGHTLLEAPDWQASQHASMRLYYQPSDGWRQVGHDWLAAAERLALKLDNDTNNASLALAFELAGSGKVLLFPGDAQVGNWKSWHQCQWPIAGSPGQALTAAELLRRTVLYKVGHHGSHNATLRQQGLELMESRDLVAMLPVDEKFAHDTYGWGMPFPFLHDRLQEKTGGRLLRADDRQRALGPEPPSGSWLSKKEWKAFRKAVEVKALKVTYTIEG